MKSGFNCVECGQNATEGSMKHPYCKKCFKKEWNNDYDKYQSIIDRHDRGIL